MITARICDRCKEPVEARCSTVTRTYGDPRDPAKADDLCERCMAELHKWFKTSPGEILEARKTPLMRYAEELRARAETMPLKEAVGEVPEGMVVFYPDERYGLVSFEKDIGMTILGREDVTYKAPYGWDYNRVRLYDDKEDGPSVGVGMTQWRSVEVEKFTLGGRTGRVVNAKQLGPRQAEKKW